MYEGESGRSDVNIPSEKLLQLLQEMPVSGPRPGFVDGAFAKATAGLAPVSQPAPRPSRMHRVFARWETWFGIALGAAATAVVAVFVLRPPASTSEPTQEIAMALNEARNIDVLIDSERDLEGATIRVAVTGSVALNGFDNDREIDWQTHLERGSNLLTLPIVARSTGGGRLVATVEHQGRSRQVIVHLTVQDPQQASRS